VSDCSTCKHLHQPAGSEPCRTCPGIDGPAESAWSPRTEATGIEALVCNEIAARQSHGIAKYGTTVADNPLALRQWLQHALEECLDQAVYLRRAIAEMDK